MEKEIFFGEEVHRVKSTYEGCIECFFFKDVHDIYIDCYETTKCETEKEFFIFKKEAE